MQRTIAALGLGCLLLAGCASGPESNTAYEEGYVPIGTNIPRKGAKQPEPSSVPTGMGPYTAGRGAPRN